jgi:hypothetical protein
MVTSALEHNSRIPSQGSDRQTSGGTSSSGDQIVVQEQARVVTDPEIRPKEEVTRLTGGDLDWTLFREEFKDCFKNERREVAWYDIMASRDAWIMEDYEYDFRIDIARALLIGLKEGTYPVSEKIWNSVPDDQRTRESIMKAIIRRFGWKAVLDQELIQRDIVRARDSAQRMWFRRRRGRQRWDRLCLRWEQVELEHAWKSRLSR